METENVEIIKALVRTNVGITIISFQSVAREFASHQLFCAPHRRREPDAPHRLGLREGEPRPARGAGSARRFERIRPRLKLSPSGGRPASPARRAAGDPAAGGPAGRGLAAHLAPGASRPARQHPPDIRRISAFL